MLLAYELSIIELGDFDLNLNLLINVFHIIAVRKFELVHCFFYRHILVDFLNAHST